MHRCFLALAATLLAWGSARADGLERAFWVWHRAALLAALEKAHIVASLRHDRAGRDYLRFSPHFYNTEAELDRAVAVLSDAR